MSRETKEYYSERLFLGKEGMVAIRAKAECSIGEPDGTVYPDADMQIVCGEDGVWLSFEANRAGVNKAKLLANVTKRFAAALDWNTEADEGLALQDPVTSCTISLSDNGRFNVTRREGWNLTYIGDAPKEEAYALMGFDPPREPPTLSRIPRVKSALTPKGAKAYELSRSRVWQIQDKAIRKLRNRAFGHPASPFRQ